MSKNAIYAQSGGVTAVINASACGIIETARKYPDQIGKVYAGRNGIVGILKEDLIDTSEESSESIARLRTAPSGAFGSCRYKLKSIQESRDAYQRLIDVFAAHEIGYFFYNGGGDSADTCLKIAQISEQMGYPVQALHVPKTVDNDLPVTDSSPGFGSAAKYIATSVLEASLDVASMSLTSTKVFILEVMGRHSGWMAAAGGMASSQSHPIPLVILFPEIAFDREQFIQRVRSTVSEHGQVSIVVSEGVADKDGRFLAGQDGSDAFGHQQLGGVAPTLSTAISTSYCFANRCRAGLCSWRIRRADGTGRGEFGDASDCSHKRPSLSMENRQGFASGSSQCREKTAGAFHRRERIWNHASLPGLYCPADGGRRLS